MNRSSCKYILVLAGMMTGCSSVNVQLQPSNKIEPAVKIETEKNSMAMNLALAARITSKEGPLTDTEVDKLESNEAGVGFYAGQAYLAARGFSGALPKPSGMSNDVSGGAELAIAAMVYFMGNDKPPAAYNRWLVWIPKASMTPKQAKDWVEKSILDAYNQALPEEYKAIVINKPWTATFGGKQLSRMVLLSGGNCAIPSQEEIDDVSITTYGIKNHPDYCVLNTSWKGAALPGMTGAPAWVKSSGTYYNWGMLRDDGSHQYIIGIDTPNRVADKESRFSKMKWREFVANMTDHLPESFFFYSAPSSEDETPPMVFNAGKTHLFIKTKSVVDSQLN